MRLLLGSTLLCALVAAFGCGSDDKGKTARCEPELALNPSSATIAPLATVAFSATGGKGAYNFELLTTGSGARLDANSGAYLAGSTTGVRDSVRVRAAGCAGEAVAEVYIPDVLDVQPARAEVPPNTTFTFVVTRGSGSFTFQLSTNSSGAQLGETGTYTAGANDGDDVVRVSDAVTGSFKDVRLAVRASARLDADPPVVALPLGSRTVLHARGGSGHVTGSPESDIGVFADGVLRAAKAGTTNVTLTDVFTRQTTQMRFVVAPDLDAPTMRGGDKDGFVGTLLPPIATADIDSDDVNDVIVGYADTSSSGAVSGAVYAFTKLSEAAGRATPVLQLDGRERAERFGSALATADFDGDGHADLAIGAPASDKAFPDAGAVYIFRGDGAGGFAEAQVFTGDGVGDNFGSSLAACDFDGDGAIDLAVGAPNAESEAANRNQGSVALLFGGSSGLASGGMQRVYGALPDTNGVQQPVLGFQLGSAIAAADTNRDGRCELYAGAIGFAPSGGVAGSGAIVAYGVDSSGLFTTHPTMVIRSLGGAVAPGLGRTIVVRDLDKDGTSEILTGESGTASGRALVFRIHYDGTQLTTTDAALTLAGAAPGDACGAAADAADLDGDTSLEILVGCHGANTSAQDAGAVRVYNGRGTQLPATTPSRTISGASEADHFGNQVVAVGDVNGDEAVDLIVHVRDGDTNGLNFGTLELLPTSGAVPFVDLALPGRSSLQALGGAVAFVGEDVLVGAPGANVVLGVPNVDGLDAGRVLRYRDGVVVGTYEKHATHGTGDLFGTQVVGLGDFDGDGLEDFAVLAAGDKRPQTFPPSFDAESTCPGATGAVYIYSGEELTPRFAVFGPAGDVVSIAGGLDFDHDGRCDLAIGGVTWDGRGGARVYLGRSAVTDKTKVLCAPALDLRGNATGDRFGGQLTALGDLDGDGCDELAVAADNYESTAELQNEGGALIVYGTGSGCASGPRYAMLHSALPGGTAGASLAAADLDNDGKRELVIGSVAYAQAGVTYGAYWVMNGSALAAATPSAAAPHPQVAIDVPLLLGPESGEQYGSAVAVRAATASSPGLVLIGIPLSGDSGVARSGAVFAYPYVAETGLSDVAAARFGGEAGPDGSFGAAIAVRGGRVVIGAPASDGLAPNLVSVDDGEAYVFSFE